MKGIHTVSQKAQSVINKQPNIALASKLRNKKQTSFGFVTDEELSHLKSV